MKPANDIEELFHDAAVDTRPEMDRTILHRVLAAHETANANDSTLNRSSIRSTIMKNPIMKLAIAAAIIVAVLIVIGQLGGSATGVAWGEVARKAESSGGVVVRVTETNSLSLGDDDYSIKYFTPTHSRTDSYKNGRVVRTFHTDLEAMTLTALYHPHKHYISGSISPAEEGFLERQEDWMNPRYLVQKFLSAEHRQLERKAIDGVMCEGLETSDPAIYGRLPGPVSRLDVQMRLWVSTETQYPVQFEWKVNAEAEGQAVTSEGVMDQFQWDVELDPSLFEPNIPPDYEDMRNL